MKMQWIINWFKIGKKIPKTEAYRAGSVYQSITHYGATGAISKDDLIRRVAKATGKDPKLISFAIQVMMNPRHRSNAGRSRGEIKNGKVCLKRIV